MAKRWKDSDRRPFSPPGDCLGRRRFLLLIGAAVPLASLPGMAVFWPAEAAQPSKAYALAPESALPDSVRKAPPMVREAYRFAVANRQILSQIPCYCGCGPAHKSNVDCYIKSVTPDGKIEFDLMSLG